MNETKITIGRRVHVPHVVRVQWAILISTASLFTGVVIGLYTARLDIGQELARQGRQIEINTKRLDHDAQAIQYVVRLAHPAGGQITQQQHAELIHEIEVNRAVAATETKELRSEMRTVEGKINDRLDGILALLATHRQHTEFQKQPR